MGYHFITVDIVMRDCASDEDAVTQLIRLMPNNPDETTAFMESWEVAAVSSPDSRERLRRLIDAAEANA